MCLESAVDNNTTGLDNMNNIRVAPLTTPHPKIELSVRFGRIIDTLSFNLYVSIRNELWRCTTCWWESPVKLRELN